MEITFDDMLNLQRALLITHHVWNIEFGEEYYQTKEMKGLIQLLQDFRDCNWFEFTDKQLDAIMSALNYRVNVEKTNRYDNLYNRVYEEYKKYLLV